MKNLEQIPQFLEFYRHKKLRVGFSGGADSTALLLKLLQWGFAPQQLEAVHFDHGLRGEASKNDARWCQDFCAERQIPFIKIELKLLERLPAASSLEAFARYERMQWYRSHDDGSAIVLAHHADDRLETMLLKLARGGNSSAGSSLRCCRKLWGLTVLRPLLDYHKTELEDFLRQNNVKAWCIDSTNQSCDFHRNYLRNKLLPEWSQHHPPLINGLKQAANTLELDADFIEHCAAGKLAQLGVPLPETTTKEFWLEQHPALRMRVLRSYLAHLLNDDDLQLEQTRIQHFNQALQLPDSPEKRIIELSGNCRFSLRNGIWQWLKTSGEPTPEKRLWLWQQEPQTVFGIWQLQVTVLPGAVSGPTPNCFYFDRNSFPEELYLHFRQGGESMTVWGSSRPRRVKHLLCSINDKAQTVLVSDKHHQIYLLGNLRRSALAPVSCNTKNTVKIEIIKLNR